MFTPTPLGVIEVPKRFSGKPAEIALVLSHENLSGSQFTVAQSLHEFRRDNGMIPISCAPITPARKKNKYFVFLFIDKFTLGMRLFRRVLNPPSCVTNESPSPGVLRFANAFGIV
jgi:hypothetical protein